MKALLSGITLASLLLTLTILSPTERPSPNFEAQTIDDQVVIGYGLGIGDVDGDGDPDILLADKKQIVWYRNGDWERFVMVEDLTERDNVCIAARDINGDGKVEVAVGAQWNPRETSDLSQSGTVHYLIRPDDPTQPWQPIQLHHEPTIHRMRWVKQAPDTYSLVVVPLHGRDNQQGQGKGVQILAYDVPDDPQDEWTTTLLDSTMHMTHNFDVVTSEDDASERLYLGGREGVHIVTSDAGQWPTLAAAALPWMEHGVGEIRHGKLADDVSFLTTIEPMHGTELAVYVGETNPTRQVLDDIFVQGHALAVADLLGLGRDQIVAGWRNPNAEEKVGIKLYIPLDDTGMAWEQHLIDDNTMAVEDLKVADLNNDGKPEIIAVGRATNNLKVYWNRTEAR